MNEILATTIAPDSICLITNDGNTQVLTGDSHKNYDAIREALKTGDKVEAVRLIDLTAEMAARYAPVGDRIKIEHGVLALDERAVGGVIADRILTMLDEGFDIAPMCKFVENLYDNPSKRAVTELYGFLEASTLPITEDGHFLAYKMVRSDFKSHHDGKTDNSVGKVVSMPRNAVNENANETCSDGLHFCSQGYLNSYASSGVTLIVKINPKDVVSIPTDYNNAKGRACEYLVTGVFNVKPTTEHTFGSSVADENMEKTGVTAESVDEQLEGGIPVGELNVFAATGTKADPVDDIAKGTYRDVATGRPIVLSGGVSVQKDGAFNNGDVVFKRDACDQIDITMDELLELISNQMIDVIENSNGHDLVVWNDSYCQ